MSEFILTSAQGKFPVPDGESRIGSDSSCPVCIQGEGVLPVHAYLKVDGSRLMIRPSSEKSPVFVDGQPVAGPQALSSGQAVSIGPLQLRLATQGSPPLRLLSRRWFRGCLYGAGTVAALGLAVVALRYFYFNDAWCKARIIEQVEKALRREDVEIGSVQVTLLDGDLLIRDLKVPNKKDDLTDEKNPLLRVREIHGKLDVWALVKSWFKELRSSSLQLVEPELWVERWTRNGRAATNVDDILAHYLEGAPRLYPLDLGLAALETGVTLERGRVVLRDRHARTDGDTSLEEVHLSLKQQGLGEKLRYELSAASHSPNQLAGHIGLHGEFKLVNESGQIDPREIGQGVAYLDLEKFDLARLCHHLDWSFSVPNERLQVVPGKPLDGKFSVNFQDLKNFKIDGWAESKSVLSVVEKDQAPLGNIPTYLAIELNYDTARGPLGMRLDLRSAKTPEAARNPAQPQILTLKALGKPDSEGNYIFESDFNANLQDFCATDVGTRLNLKDRLRGRLAGTSRLVRSAAGQWQEIVADLTQNGEVWVPGSKNDSGVWQPTSVAAHWSAHAKPNEDGKLKALDAEFWAKAGSFEAKSTTPASLESLDDLDKLSFFTKFKLDLNGREFFKEFKPVLDLLGYTRPVEEILDLDVMVSSRTRAQEAAGEQQRITLGLDGKALRQWTEDPKPVKILGQLDYFPAVLAKVAKPTQGSPPSTDVPPAFKLTLQVGGEETPPFVRIQDAELRRAGSHELLSVPSLIIRSDLEALRDRFNPYLERMAELAGMAEAYREYAWSGQVTESGSFGLVRNLPVHPGEGLETEARFDFTLEGQHLAVAGPVPGAAPAEGAARRWKWSDPKPRISLKGSYGATSAASEEEPPRERLDLEALDMQGGLGAFKLSAREVDLWALRTLLTGRKPGARLMGKVLPDTLDSFRFSGHVTPAAFDLLRALEFLPSAPLARGTLKLNVDYKRPLASGAAAEREGGRLVLKELVFENPAADGFWLKSLNVSAEIRGVRDLFVRAAEGRLNPLEHLGEFLVVRSLALDAEAFKRWLAEYSGQAQALHIPGALARTLVSGPLIPEGIWQVEDLELHPGGTQERSWNLVGKFRNDLRCVLPALPVPPGGTPAGPALLAFQGPWSISKQDAAAFSFSPDYRTLSVVLCADFTTAQVGIRNLLPGWDYVKPAAEPLRLKLQGAYSPGKGVQDTLGGASLVKLLGGPLPMEFSELEFRSHPDPKTFEEQVQALILRKGKIEGGPLPCTLKDLEFNREKDLFGCTLEAPDFDLGYLERLGVKLGGFRAQGHLTGGALTCAANLRGLLSGDLLHGQNRYEIKQNFKDVVLDAAPGPGEELVLMLNGDYVLNTTELRSGALDVVLRHTLPAAAGRPARKVLHNLNLGRGGLWLASPDEKLSLLGALDRDPLALRLKLPLKWKTELDVADLEAAGGAFEKILRKLRFKQADEYEVKKLELQKRLESLPEGQGEARERCRKELRELDLVLAGLKAKLSPPVPGTPPFAWLSALQVEGVLSFPRLKAGARTLEQVEVAGYTLKNLKAGVPLATAKFAGGEGRLSEAAYDLNNSRIVHDQHFQLTMADLNQLLNLVPPAQTAGYRVGGRVNLEGALKGTGFNASDRLTWDGGMEVTLQQGVAEQPADGGRPKKGEALPVWLEKAALPPFLKSAASKFAGKAVLSFSNLARDHPALLEGPPSLNGLLAGAQLYLSTLGCDASRFEFEPVRFLMTIRQGFLEVPRGRLIGKGALAGFEFAIRGRMNMLDETFGEDFALAPLTLPEAARQRLHLDRWPQEIREQFLGELADGKLPLRLTGSLQDPQISYPLDKLKRYALLATFGQERIDSPQGLEAARGHFLRTWGTIDAGIDAGAGLLDRWGAGLPRTQTAKNSGSHILDRMRLPASLKELEDFLGPTLSPEASLRRLLFPPPEPKPVPGPGPKEPAPTP